MTIPVKCPGCRSTLKLRDESAGKKAKCPRCQHTLVVPRLEEDEDIEQEEEEERPRSRKKKKQASGTSKYKPCPKCGAGGATRVKWTAWGSFYGPALVTHVRCPDCDHCYNGKTGGSNALVATLFVAVPVLGILGVIGAVLYVLRERGVF